MEAKLYAAPLEGLTGYVWRAAHRAAFGGADKYFAPFISPNQNHKFKTKEFRDLSQSETDLIPQILTEKSEHFVWAAERLGELGYDEINLNLGCPSGTVVTKGRGAGALKDLESLKRLLDEIYTLLPDTKISLKTRTGFASSEEWPALLELLRQYPVYELIIHPRCREELYKGKADRELFLETLRSENKLSLVYNGDINSPDDSAFGYGCNLMAGRGLIADPALFRRAKGGAAASREELIDFHEALLEGYREYLSGEVPLVHKMKELWFYYSASFADDGSYMKRIHKAKRLNEYLSAAEGMLQNCELTTRD